LLSFQRNITGNSPIFLPAITRKAGAKVQRKSLLAKFFHDLIFFSTLSISESINNPFHTTFLRLLLFSQKEDTCHTNHSEKISL